MVCVSNVNNCKPARRPLGGYHPRHRDLCTIEDMARERTSPNYLYYGSKLFDFSVSEHVSKYHTPCFCGPSVSCITCVMFISDAASVSQYYMLKQKHLGCIHTDTSMSTSFTSRVTRTNMNYSYKYEWSVHSHSSKHKHLYFSRH